MKLRRQQQVERELNGYRAWIDRAGTRQKRAFIYAQNIAGFAILQMLSKSGFEDLVAASKILCNCTMFTVEQLLSVK